MSVTNYLTARLRLVRALKQDEKGVTAMEYALIAALIAIIIITAVTLLGSNLSAKYTAIAGVVGTTAPTAPTK